MLSCNPRNAMANYLLGNALARQGRLGEATAHYQMALQLRPDFAQGRNNLAGALLQAGRPHEALLQFQQAVELAPADPRIKNNLAWFLATSADASLRDGNKAAELAAQANQLTGGQNPVFLRTLAAALAETGQCSEAVDIAQRALLLAGAQSRTGLTAQLQADIKLYQTGKPLRIDQKH
jgi:Flp pilus assembly protein TadD